MKSQALILLLLMPAVLLAGEKQDGSPKPPEIRGMSQLAQECALWISSIEKVKAQGHAIRYSGLGSAADRAALKGILGPYVPLAMVKSLVVRLDGTFALQFTKIHVIDVPLEKEPGYIRIKFHPTPIRGRLMKAKLVRTHTPVKVLVFEKPHAISIDRLDAKRKSTVPAVGKLLGLLPNIICFILVESKSGPRVAPQFDGMGTKDNDRMIRDLLKIDDVLLPDSFLSATR